MVSKSTEDDEKGSTECDVIIIGAGIYGIQAARTFSQLHPDAKVVVLERSSHVGGVWSQDRVYKYFWTQTPLDILEFSDMRMHTIPPEQMFCGFFPAMHVAQYLEDYIRRTSADGSCLRNRIRFNCSVDDVRKDGDVWNISARLRGSDPVTYRALKLIDCCGLTSVPSMPRPFAESGFQGHLVHMKDFAQFEKSYLSSAANDKVKRVVIVGGGKSAADAAYSCAKADVAVKWIIRESGAGPAAYASARGQLGYRNSNESFYTRLTALFLVSIFTFQDRWGHLASRFNKSSIGQSIIRRFWRYVDRRTRSAADYGRPDGTSHGFHLLEPQTELFWQNDSSGIAQREDFFDTIARNVTVLRNDVHSLTTDAVVLDDLSHTHIPTDAVVCATGWQIEASHISSDVAQELGLPTRATTAPRSGTPEADIQVQEKMPLLKSDWSTHQHQPTASSSHKFTPYRLYRNVVPVHDHSVCFLGRVMLGNHFRAAEVQALWACAVLDGSLKLPSAHSMEDEISLTNSWCKLRYLAKGALGNWFYWDLIPYTDALLSDLDLHSHRSRNAWRDLTRPCFANQLSGLIQEHRDRHDNRPASSYNIAS